MALQKIRYGVVGALLTLVYASPAFADSGLTAEQRMNLSGMICITIAADIVSAAVAIGYYWRSKLKDWTILRNCAAMVAAVSFVCFLVSAAPVLRTIRFTEAMCFLYLPVVVSTFLLLATTMWIRTIVHEQQLSYATITGVSLDTYRWRKAYRRWLRDRRIERSQRYWAKREEERKALQLKNAQKKPARKK